MFYSQVYHTRPELSATFRAATNLLKTSSFVEIGLAFLLMAGYQRGIGQTV
jgi:hypothetical protein